ncbi:MAG: tetratricopeptide repeat protein [Prevotellaceae bacterium]|jgi:tetratricopeptide (TPR) repeat protein|nr:tetratricopeptide repeat protein [Prevotellaceae bacterium]
MAKQKLSHAEDNLGAIEHSLTSVEVFIEKYQKLLIYGAVGLVLLIGVFFAYRSWYKAPLEEEAQSQLFAAVQYFEQDSLALALNGDGANLGLLDIEDRYGSTAAGNLACYYAGLAYLHTGVFDEAIAYLKKYSPGDNLSKALVNGNIGDAYSELQDYDKALSYYKKAANSDRSRLTAPRYLMKAGILLEAQRKYAEAKKIYERLKKDFPNSSEGYEADRCIARAQQRLQQQEQQPQQEQQEPRP